MVEFKLDEGFFVDFFDGEFSLRCGDNRLGISEDLAISLISGNGNKADIAAIISYKMRGYF